MGEYSNRKCTCNSVTDKKMQKEDNKVEATIGVFFDGTCNNKYNSMYTPHNRSSTNGFAKAGKRKVRIGDDCDGSYEGDLTNIAKLWETYTSSKEKRIDRVYIEGPGTEAPVKDMKSPYRDAEGWVSSNQDDVTAGFAYGIKDTGIFAKLERACKLVTAKAAMLTKGLDARQGVVLRLDLFGFRRGAAEARLFVNMIGKSPSAYTENRDADLDDALFRSMGMRVNIEVRFMGLFDTVLSYDNESWIIPNFDKYESRYDLQIGDKVKKAIHLVAADEYRKYFSLTTIDSAIKQGRGIEMVLPGAHSDIGGGYAEIVVEKMRDGCSRWNKYGLYRGFKNPEQLIQQGWITESWMPSSKNHGFFDYICSSWDDSRYVLNYYDRIPLHVMHHFMEKESIPVDLENLHRRCKISVRHKQLIELRGCIMANVTSNKRGPYVLSNSEVVFCGNKQEGNLIKDVRFTFMHLSAHRGSFGAHGANEGNKRRIRSS